MFSVKHLTLFKLKNWKNAGILTKVARKIELCSIFLQPSVAFKLDFNKKFGSLLNASGLRTLTLILIELWPFSLHNL